MMMQVDWRPSPTQLAEAFSEWNASDQALFFVRLFEIEQTWIDDKTRPFPAVAGWQWDQVGRTFREFARNQPDQDMRVNLEQRMADFVWGLRNGEPD